MPIACHFNIHSLTSRYFLQILKICLGDKPKALRLLLILPLRKLKFKFRLECLVLCESDI